VVEVEDEVEKDEVEEVTGPTHREKVPIAGMSVEMPLAIAGAWHDEPVCSQIEMGTTPRHTAVPEPIEEPPDEPAPAE